jgi:hypothetical protein
VRVGLVRVTAAAQQRARKQNVGPFGRADGQCAQCQNNKQTTKRHGAAAVRPRPHRSAAALSAAARARRRCSAVRCCADLHRARAAAEYVQAVRAARLTNSPATAMATVGQGTWPLWAWHRATARHGTGPMWARLTHQPVTAPQGLIACRGTLRRTGRRRCMPRRTRPHGDGRAERGRRRDGALSPPQRGAAMGRAVRRGGRASGSRALVTATGPRSQLAVRRIRRGTRRYAAAFSPAVQLAAKLRASRPAFAALEEERAPVVHLRCNGRRRRWWISLGTVRPAREGGVPASPAAARHFR